MSVIKENDSPVISSRSHSTRNLEPKTGWKTICSRVCWRALRNRLRNLRARLPRVTRWGINPRLLSALLFEASVVPLLQIANKQRAKTQRCMFIHLYAWTWENFLLTTCLHRAVNQCSEGACMCRRSFNAAHPRRSSNISADCFCSLPVSSHMSMWKPFKKLFFSAKKLENRKTLMREHSSWNYY